MLTHLIRIFRYGTSYALATGFFPKSIAKKVLLLYSFVRIPDNIVDEVTWIELWWHYHQARVKLLALQDERIHAYTTKNREDSVWGQYVSLFHDNQIPFEYSQAFFKAMIDDCSIHRYETYEQLEGYMYGSASVVGLMMCHLIGFTDPDHEETAKAYATDLGNAMQLTNFLRDVREDYEDLERIYIPVQILQDHGLSHEDIISFCHGGYSKTPREKQEARISAMQSLIAKCRAMYTHSLDGLQYLRPEWRGAVRLAALLYASILDKIEKNQDDVFSKSCRTSLWDKVKVMYLFYFI